MLIVFQNHESVWDALPSRLLYMLGMKSTTLPDVLYCAPHIPKKEVLGRGRKPRKNTLSFEQLSMVISYQLMCGFRCVKRTW